MHVRLVTQFAGARAFRAGKLSLCTFMHLQIICWVKTMSLTMNYKFPGETSSLPWFPRICPKEITRSLKLAVLQTTPSVCASSSLCVLVRLHAGHLRQTARRGRLKQDYHGWGGRRDSWLPGVQQQAQKIPLSLFPCTELQLRRQGKKHWQDC